MSASGFTYSFDPGASLKDEVRFLTGDTDVNEPLLMDGEIAYLLRQTNESPIAAAIKGCEAIIAKFGRLVDESVGNVRLSYSQRLEGYKKVRDELLERLALNGDCIPFAGGIYKSQEKLQDLNHNRIKPDFTKHMMENRDIAPWVTNEGPYYNQSEDESPG